METSASLSGILTPGVISPVDSRLSEFQCLSGLSREHINFHATGNRTIWFFSYPSRTPVTILIDLPVWLINLWCTEPLLRGYSVNNSRCYAAPAAYACTVTSHNNRRGDADGVFCRSAPRLYDWTDRVLLSEWVQCSWGFTCGMLTSGQRKRNNLHC
jgi:hypothetical protein